MGPGSFTFPSVVPGTYTVKVESPGFRTYQKSGNVLSANERLSLGNLQLQIGTLAETVTVKAEGVAVQTASSEGSAQISSGQLSNVQQKGHLIIGFLTLLPGVSNVIATPESANGYFVLPNIGGTRANQQTLAVDGMQGQDAGASGAFTQGVSPDAVEEVKVLLNNYTAEYGRNGGSYMNVVTKSGTKDFHGTVYYYKRHEMFNANDFFNNAAGLPKARYRYYSEGFTIGGPLTIPRLFNKSREKLFFL
jgi:outer membrane receptor protein involved in Fe transport